MSYACVILGGICWGFIGVFNRMLGAAGLTMANRMVVRNFLSLLLLTAVFALFRRSVFRVSPRHLPLFAASGIVSVLGNAWAFFSCQMECSLAVAATLLYLAPAFVTVLSALLWKTRITPRKAAALLLAFAGCALVSGIAGGALTISRRGLLLGLTAAFLYGMYTVFAHYGLQHYDSLTMTYWSFVFSGLASLAFADAGELLPVLQTGRGIAGAAGLVIIATVLPYSLYTKGLEGVESGKAAILANVEPVMAAILGIVIFHEQLSAWAVLGIVCVLGGVVILAKEDEADGKA